MNRHQGRRIRAGRVALTRLFPPEVDSRARTGIDAIIRDASIHELRDEMLSLVSQLLVCLVCGGVFALLFFMFAGPVFAYPMVSFDPSSGLIGCAAFASLGLIGALAAIVCAATIIADIAKTGRALRRTHRAEADR
jgi:hypothetical protein